MIEIDIPGFGHVELEHMVTDFTGTLSVDGKLLAGVKEKLNEAAKAVEIHVLTADTFGTAREQLDGVNCDIKILDGENLDMQKQEFVLDLEAERVAAIGNGNNDRLMLKAARLGIAVCLAEGCARDALMAANVFVTSPIDAIDLLLNPQRLIATLRF